MFIPGFWFCCLVYKKKYLANKRITQGILILEKVYLEQNKDML